MKKALLLIGVLALALGITYLVLHKNSADNKKPDEKDPALLVGSKSSAFNRSFAAVLSRYFDLSHAVAGADTSMISSAARRLGLAADSIRFDQFKADTLIVETAVSLAQSFSGEIAGLIGEKTLEQKKKEFNMITEDLYSLIRTVKYDGSVIYHMSCPTAFPDSTEGTWLSEQSQVKNPYAPTNSNADCGEVKDSLHFSAPASP